MENSIRYLQICRDKSCVFRERDHGVPEVKGWQEILGVVKPIALVAVFVLGLMLAELIL